MYSYTNILNRILDGTEVFLSFEECNRIIFMIISSAWGLAPSPNYHYLFTFRYEQYKNVELLVE